MIWTILIFIILLGLLVFVHEFGHFFAAKKSGMRVLEFGFGFPPRLLGVKKTAGQWKLIWGHGAESFKIDGDAGGRTLPDSTLYSINAIPLGGFVRIWGENNEHEEDPRSFINRPFFSRLATLIAGVGMNVALAWGLTSIGFILGIPTAVDAPSALPAQAKFEGRHTAIVEIFPESPAQKSGLLAGDAILQVDGQDFSSGAEIRKYIFANAGKIFDFKIKRAGREVLIAVESKAALAEGEGPTGIALAEVGRLSFPWYASFWEGAKATFFQLSNIVTGLYHLLTSRAGLQALGGPVKIAQITGQVADMGFIYLLQFTSFLSLNLAVLNILPFPALDGGRVLFLIIEKLRRKRNNPKIEQAINAAGFAFLILMMILVTIQDVRGFGR